MLQQRCDIEDAVIGAPQGLASCRRDVLAYILLAKPDKQGAAADVLRHLAFTQLPRALRRQRLQRRLLHPLAYV